MNAKRKTSPFTWAFLLGFGVCVVAYIGGSLLINIINDSRDSIKPDNAISVKPCNAVSAKQIIAISKAIDAYTAKHSRRPDRLEKLIPAGLIDTKVLFDDRRSQMPDIDTATKRFTVNPDVIYFPALHKTDPGDLVLLCTMVLREEGGKFQIVYNDGRHVQCDSRELIPALQRTYTYLGKLLQATKN